MLPPLPTPTPLLLLAMEAACASLINGNRFVCALDEGREWQGKLKLGAARKCASGEGEGVGREGG